MCNFEISFFFCKFGISVSIYLRMPRQARKRSVTAIYHVILRGMDKMSLFYDDNDRKLFLKQLKSQVCPDFEIYCYCLMTNHIHLLVKSNLLSHYMHHIAFVYAMWFNAKYHRKGYLFQDRFRSEGIETENYYNSSASFVNVGFIKNFFSDRIQFEKYLLERNQTSFLEYLSERQMRDERLREMLKALLRGRDIHTLAKNEQKMILRQMLRETDVELRQLARISGVSIGIIRYLNE